jgi:hypothetical protein
LETIYSWLGEYVGKHRDASLWSLPPEIRQRLAKMDERRQTHLLMFNVLSRRNPLAPRPKPEEIDALIAKLSPQAQSLLKQSDNAADVFGVLSTWGRSAVFSKAFPVVTKEELATFFEKLPPEERDRLERMTPEDRDNEVKQLYARQSFFGIRPGERLFEPFGPPRKER